MWGAFPPLVCEKCFLRTKYSSPRSKMHVTDVVVVMHHSVGNPFLWLVLSCCSLIPQLFWFFPTFFYFNQAGWFRLHFSANAHHLSIALVQPLNPPTRKSMKQFGLGGRGEKKCEKVRKEGQMKEKSEKVLKREEKGGEAWTIKSSGGLYQL